MVRRAAALVAGIAGLVGLSALPAHAADQPIASGGLAVNEDGYVLGSFDMESGVGEGGVWTPDGTQITYLPYEPGYPSNSVSAFNDHNVVVGAVQDTAYVSHPVRWNRDGTITNLPGGTHGQANGIDDSGVIVGGVGGADQPTFPVRWDRDGELTALPVPPGTVSGAATAINNRGVILGHVSTGGVNHPLLWYPDGHSVSLAIDPTAVLVQETGLNIHGYSVGYEELPGFQFEAVRWSPDGQATVLSPNGQANGINDEGVAAGGVYDANYNVNAVTWSLEGQTTILPSPPGNYSGTGAAAGINNAGYVVGSNNINGFDVALEWTPDGQVINLTALTGGQ